MFVSKWHMHRMGLVDFWYYVNEEFYFKDGHMLLRGSNGSGKSVTMQSFIPLLLDGNKSSERLDSFGTRSRKIENYLLEEDGDRDDRIGYLYLEFKREDADIYKTIGMGLHARRNKPMNTWYFVIEDNRRVNIDFYLMEHQLAITKQMLKNIIGSQLIENQKDYMDRVNQSLFGFASRDDYKEAINLLMQLRSPKLSNSLKPTIINDILSNSLQPLSEDDLRPMSEAIANMDEIKDQLDALKLSYAAAKDIAQVYTTYNHVVLDSKAVAYLEEEQKWKQIKKQITTIEQAIATKQRTKEENAEQLAKLHLEQSVLNEEKHSLLQQDMLTLVDDITRHKEELEAQNAQAALKEMQCEEKDNRRIDAKKSFEEAQNKQQVFFQRIKALLQDMDELQEELQFEEHTHLKEELLDHLEQEYDATLTQKQIKEVLNQLTQGLMIFEKLHYLEEQELHYHNDREEYLMQQEQVQKEVDQYRQMFKELQEELKESFSRWNKNNELLHMSDEQMLNIMHDIQLFDVEDHFVEIDEMVHKVYLYQYQQITNKEINLTNTLKQYQQELLAVQKELEHWQTQQDPKPLLDNYMMQSRTYLEEQSIAFQPLYQFLEFAESVPMEKRNHCEEILQRAGLLNALLVDQQTKEQIMKLGEGVADQYLFTTVPLTDLSIYYIEEQWLDQGDFSALFAHFHLSEMSFEVHPTHYELGSMTGTISQQEGSRFIGKQSRERYRKEMIDSLTAKRQELETMLNQITEDINKVHETHSTLKKEFHAVPKPNDLHVAKQQIQSGEKDLEAILKRIQKVNEELKILSTKINEQKRTCTDLAAHLNIATTKASFQQHQEAYEAYEAMLREVLAHQKQYCSSYELSISFRIQLEDLQQDVDTLRAEGKGIEAQVEKLQLLIQQKETQLAGMGYEDVKKRMEEIQDRLFALPTLISTADRLDAELATEIAQREEQCMYSYEQLEKQKERKEQFYQRYQQEAALFYVCHDAEAIKQVDMIHKKICEAYPDHKRKDVLGNDLQTSFYAHRGALQEYSLSIFTLFDEEESARLDISARYQGMKIPFLQLLDHLQKDIEKQSILLEDSDRALIEDILVNTISKKIRGHIQGSKRWVDTMNRYMNAMNTSSGLKLNLQWKSRKAETEEEMSSEKLVELLEKDVRILKDVDLKRLSSHFRSKIAMARKLAEREDTHESFHQIMKKIMDYRTWFDFRILSQKTGEKKKELTNNAFYAFSGGEKAMAMYVPLFSAVAAKFESANEDAPLMIALDEAFAGVDEKNINNMFDLIHKFKFDFIMNSQVLWGDYPSVKALAIYELYRPENAHYVTVIAYEWNGHTKKLVTS